MTRSVFHTPDLTVPTLPREQNQTGRIMRQFEHRRVRFATETAAKLNPARPPAPPRWTLNLSGAPC